VHELSIIVEIINTIENELGSSKEDGSVVSLTLQIGEMSSIIPGYIREYYPEAVKDTILEGAELLIEVIPATAQCKACDTQFGYTGSEGTCPECGGRKLKLLRGREFFIKEIVLDSTVNK